MEVDHVARNGLRKANRQLVDSVLPYRMNEKENFSMGYLSGFLAENRDMEKEQFVLDVQTEVRQFALQSLQDQAGSYSSMQVRKKEAGIRMRSGVMPCFLYGPLHIMTRPGERYTISLSTGRPEKSAESCLWTGRRL